MNRIASFVYPKVTRIVGVVAAFLFVAALSLVFVYNTANAAVPSSEVSILFTHDMHSRLDAERYMAGTNVAQRGGFARMQSAVDSVRGTYPDSLLLDAGDFSMGTIYQTIYSSDASELRMMGRLGFDATTLGNHEFDYRTQGLTDMLTSALASKEPLPALTIANIDWARTEADEDRVDDALELKEAMQHFDVPDYLVIEKGDLKVAVFGLLGKEADRYAPLSGLYFKDPIETARLVVARIKAETDADIIICLSHSGTKSDPKKSEDELLAKAVPEIDVIISGHTHTRLEEPIVIGNTLVVSCGAYTYDLGHLVLERAGDRYTVKSYELLPVDERLTKNAKVEAALQEFRDVINEKYLSRFDCSFDEVLAEAPFGFTPIDTFGNEQGEEPLGNLISDAFIAAVKEAEGVNYRNVDVAIVPYGTIRASLAKGPVTVADAYNVSSLGIGPDKVPGYPLVSLYLTGAELKTAAEVDISISTLMIDARLYMSGLTYTYNPNRLILNRVTSVQLVSPEGRISDLDDAKLYRVVGGLYSCQMLGEVEAQSYGLLSITPKDVSGKPIGNFEQHIIYSDEVELKEWVALANYLASFDAVDGTPRIPEYYSQLHDRKVLDDSNSLVDILKNPNKIAFIVLGVIVVVLAILIVPTVLIIRRVRRRSKRARLAKAQEQQE